MIGESTQILPQILSEIEAADKNGSLKWQDEDDGLFFKNAINKCYNLNQSSLAIQLFNILMSGSNRQFLVNHMDEARFL